MRKIDEEENTLSMVSGDNVLIISIRNRMGESEDFIFRSRGEVLDIIIELYETIRDWED